MTPSAKHRQDAALRELDPLPLPTADHDHEKLQQDAAWLLALAETHPRTRSLVHSHSRPARRQRARRGAVALGLALAGLAGGGVALATTGGWDQIAASWDDMTGHDPQRQAATPQMVARGTGTSSSATGITDLQLIAAPTADGGQCVHLGGGASTQDTCYSGQDTAPKTPLAGLGGQAFYQSYFTSQADYLWGHVDPQQVATLRVSATDRDPVTATVDRTTGYWVTSIIDTNAAHPLTLTAIAPDSRTLLSQTIAP